MNKFESMKYFDSIRFDYLLWLDADIVVLGDPISSGELKKHTHPGI
jgi:lipopolysaccharide biosynthesis glycosyltransferase